MKKVNGLVHLYIGTGKGKTTAAMGLAVRQAGYGGKVLITQFLKDGSTSELKILRGIEAVEVMSCETCFGFTFAMDEQTKRKAKSTYAEYFASIVQKVKDEPFQLLVLDEIVDACNAKMIEEQTLIDFLKNKPEELEVVMTGRNPSDEVFHAADYVTEMNKIKHPYDQGITARDGIEK